MPRPIRYAVTTEDGHVVMATSDQLLDAYEQGRPDPPHVARIGCECPRCLHVIFGEARGEQD